MSLFSFFTVSTTVQICEGHKWRNIKMKEKVNYEIIQPFLLELKKELSPVDITMVTDNHVVFKKEDEEVAVIKYNFDDEEIEVTGTAAKKLLVKLLKLEKEKKEFFVEDTIKKTVLHDLISNKQHYGGYADNIKLFKKANDFFKRLNIKKIYMHQNITSRNEILKNLSVFINPDYSIDSDEVRGFSTRAVTRVFADFPHTHKEKEQLTQVIGNGRKISIIGEEEVIPIMLYGFESGYYYKDRNLIILYINPFLLSTITPISTELPDVFDELQRELTEIKIKKTDTTGIIRKNFLVNFMGSVKENLTERTSMISRYSDEIQQYDRRKIEIMRNKKLAIDTVEYLKNLIATGGDDMIKDLDKLDKLPFLETYNLTNDSLELVYKPTFLTVKDFTRNSKKFGLRKVYLGKITINIYPTKIVVKNSHPFKVEYTNPHTHADSEGRPCFGEGDAADKISQFRVDNKFYELATMLWFWINTHRDNGAYHKIRSLYDDRLAQGLPVLDERGELITINDPDRLKTGEQIELTKQGTWEENNAKIDMLIEEAKK